MKHRKQGLGIAEALSVAAVALSLFCSGAGAQVKTQSQQTRSITDITNRPQNLKMNKTIQNAFAHTVRVTATGSMPGGMADGSYSTLIGLLRKQSVAARSLLLPYHPANAPASANKSGPLLPQGTSQTGTLLNGGTTKGLNPQPYPPKGTSQIGASQTMSSPGNSSGVATPTTGGSSRTTGNFNVMPAAAANSPTPTNGPTRQQPAGGGRQPVSPIIGSKAPLTSALCRAGIGSVDGAANGIWFSPVAGQDGQFVIQGCGFGNAPGEVYLSGVQFDPAHARLIVQHLGASDSPDRVFFQTPANEWSDRQIVAQIDPNASGLYDTHNVTLNVKTASGQVYQVIGMNFVAAREPQLLKGLPLPPPCTPQDTGPACVPVGLSLAKVSSAAGVIIPLVESPSLGLLRSGDTIATARGVVWDRFPIPAAPAFNFPGGTDAYQFNFAPGFQLHEVELRHASIDSSYCQEVNGVYSSTGQWAVNQTSTSSFQISWGEEACGPKTAITNGNPLDVLDYASMSAYELEITVLGPRGVSPWASGNQNGLAIKQLQPAQMLKKQ